MKIVHISTSSTGGGAAIAARRLHDALSAAGVDSVLLTSKDDVVFTRSSIIMKGLKRLWKNIYLRYHAMICAKYDVKGTWSDGTGTGKITDYPEIAAADIVCLHWINGNYISIEEIGHLLDTGKPVVWIMHDMWPFTGGCHHSFDCDRYRSHCGACPMLTSRKENDLSYQVFERKVTALEKRQNLILVAPSNWLGECAKRSFLFKNKRVEVIPNLLDTDKFHPIEKKLVRTILGLPSDKKIILFGCDAGSKNYYKGWNYLEAALPKMNLSGCELVVFGQEKDKFLDHAMPVKTHYLGRLNDEFPSLVLAYSAADVFVSPSIAENFSLALCEAAACGVPEVCFEIGGNSDIVLHRETGYLAKYRDSSDLAAGMEWVLNHPNREQLGISARKHIQELCSKPVAVPRYINLFQSIINL